MKLPEALRLRLLGKAQEVMRSREPDVVIGDDYVLRWMLYPKNRWRNVYIHWFGRSDGDAALHDHEPDNISLILEGRYREHFHVTPKEPELVEGQLRLRTWSTMREQGAVVGRLAGTAHRVELVDGPVVTMFVQGPRRRKWGFHCPNGWMPWDEYIDQEKSYGNRSGKGCG